MQGVGVVSQPNPLIQNVYGRPLSSTTSISGFNEINALYGSFG